MKVFLDANICLDLLDTLITNDKGLVGLGSFLGMKIRNVSLSNT